MDDGPGGIDRGRPDLDRVSIDERRRAEASRIGRGRLVAQADAEVPEPAQGDLQTSQLSPPGGTVEDAHGGHTQSRRSEDETCGEAVGKAVGEAVGETSAASGDSPGGGPGSAGPGQPAAGGTDDGRLRETQRAAVPLSCAEHSPPGRRRGDHQPGPGASRNALRA